MVEALGHYHRVMFCDLEYTHFISKLISTNGLQLLGLIQLQSHTTSVSQLLNTGHPSSSEGCM